MARRLQGAPRQESADRRASQPSRRRSVPAGNTFGAMIEAIDLGATTGEVTGAIRVGYGQDFDPLGVVDSPVAL